jgi:hypothetical protein
MNIEEPQTPEDSNPTDDASSDATPEEETSEESSEETSGEAPVAPAEAEPEETQAPLAPTDDVGIESGLERAHSRIGSVSARINSGSNLTLGVGGLLLVMVSGFFLYGLPQMDELLDPKLVVPRIEVLLEDEGIPALRRFATDFAKNNSKDVAKQLNQTAIDGLPTVRKVLEDHAVDQLNGMIDERFPATEKKFVTMLRQSKPQLEKTFAELNSQDEEVRKRAVKELVAVLEVGLQRDFEDDVQILLATLYHVNTQAKKILGNQGLSAEENLIRQMVATVRRIKLDAGDPALADAKTNVSTRSGSDIDKNKPEAKDKDKPKAKPKDEPKAKPKDKPKAKPKAS